MEQLNKEELDKLLEINGQTRGVVFYTDASYVVSKEGESGLEKLEETVKRFDYPINYRSPQKTKWYPIGLRAISLLLIKNTFDWSEEVIKDIGFNAPNYSFIIKIFMKFFLSMKKVAEQSPKLWQEHYKNAGKLISVEVDEEKRFYILRIEGLKVHPILCTYLSGYFRRVCSFAVKSNNIECKETKCVFRGDPYDEFLITW